MLIRAFKISKTLARAKGRRTIVSSKNSHANYCFFPIILHSGKCRSVATKTSVPSKETSFLAVPQQIVCFFMHNFTLCLLKFIWQLFFFTVVFNIPVILVQKFCSLGNHPSQQTLHSWWLLLWKKRSFESIFSIILSNEEEMEAAQTLSQVRPFPIDTLWQLLRHHDVWGFQWRNFLPRHNGWQTPFSGCSRCCIGLGKSL